MRLILFLLLFFQESKSGSEDTYCAYQDRSVRVTEGKSVTILCEIAFPKYLDSMTEVHVHWYESGFIECSHDRAIYNSSTNRTNDRYKTRVTVGQTTDGRRKESITIRKLNKIDGPVICCQVDIKSPKGNYTFYSSQGTHLLFSDQIWVDQLDSVGAWAGETVTIPCHVNLQYAAKKSFLKEVTWSTGSKCHAHENNILLLSGKKSNPNRFSLINFPNGISLDIKNIHMDDNKIYCCSVKINETVYRALYGTKLLIQETKKIPELNISQPEESSSLAGGDATIPCSFNTSIANTSIDKLIYWRSGSPVGHIVYHPSRWMVHPIYKGRSNLTGQANLRLAEITVIDSNVYYCIMILKFCVGNQNIMTSMSYGAGTKLTVTENNDQTGLKKDPKLAIIISSITILLIVIVLIGVLFFMKGNCRKKDNKMFSPEMNVNDSVNTGNLIQGEQVEEVENDQLNCGIVYAQLNMSEGGTRKLHQHSNQESRVIYATINR